MSVSIGDPAPDFSLDDIDGIPTTLTEHRGRKVMLSFYRSAACPFCNYAIDELQGRYKKLAWAVKLDVIAVFQSPTEKIDDFILKSRQMTTTEFPFVLLSDEQLMAFGDYQVKENRRKSVFGFLSGHRASKDCEEYYAEFTKKNNIDNEIFVDRNPSDFLIDEKGVIIDIFRANTMTEHISVDRINSFLLFGKSPRQLNATRSERRSFFRKSSSRNGASNTKSMSALP